LDGKEEKVPCYRAWPATSLPVCCTGGRPLPSLVVSSRWDTQLPTWRGQAAAGASRRFVPHRFSPSRPPSFSFFPLSATVVEFAPADAIHRAHSTSAQFLACIPSPHPCAPPRPARLIPNRRSRSRRRFPLRQLRCVAELPLTVVGHTGEQLNQPPTVLSSS